MKAAVVVNIKAGEEYDVYIGRPSKWGNPYTLGRERRPSGGDEQARAAVLARYRSHVLGRPDLLNALEELRGKRLGCYCAPLACHGDVLVELLETIAAQGLDGLTGCADDQLYSAEEARALLRPSDCGGLVE